MEEKNVLRFLILFLTFLCCLVSQAAEQSNKAVTPKYVEPTSQDLEKGKALFSDSIKRAEALSKSSLFLDDIRKERENLRGVPIVLPPPSSINLDEMFMEKGSTKRWLSKVMEGHQNMSLAEKGTQSSRVPIVLVSQSMGDEALLDYIREAKKIGAVTALRGVVGDLKETVKKLRDLAKKGGGGIVIDPTLFRRFDVTQIPTLIMPTESLKPCKNEGCETPDHIKASGHVTIEYFLELVSRVGDEFERRQADQWLGLMRKNTKEPSS
jgi:type-F conjugative transfer system pilin assembly protein TrbC